jgi:asparagine synthetase B (glutamine-hydrolysing)
MPFWGEINNIKDIANIDVYGSFSSFTKHNIYLYLNARFYKSTFSKHFNTNSSIEEQLVEAYIKKGINFIKHLRGEWVILIIDRNINQFYLTRDQSSYRTLYYKQKDNSLFFASNINKLLKISGKPELNAQKVEQFVHSNYKTEATFFKHIKSVPVACYLKKNLANTLSIVNYWQVEKIKIPAKTFEDYYKLYVKALHDAIDDMDTCTNAGISLSAGQDSSIIASILAKKHSQINTYTQAPLYETISNKKCTNEWPYVEEFVKQFKNIIPHKVTHQKAILQELNKLLEIYNQPIFAASNAPYIRQIYKAALQDHIKNLYDGFGGNFSATWSSLNNYNKHYQSKIGNIAKPYFNWSLLVKNIFLIKNGKMPYANTRAFKNHIFGIGWRQNGILSHFAEHYKIKVSMPLLHPDLLIFSANIPEKIYFNNKTTRALSTAYLRRNTNYQFPKRGMQASDIFERYQQEATKIADIYRHLTEYDLINKFIDHSKNEAWTKSNIQSKMRELHLILFLYKNFLT